ncbi:PREDICTED: probable splicing factor 3A subunit 1 [Camelina sativa]|uniref:Probable splicing factor 3A subunit 1 n=1 Tax=Camelina sativa TaxID=90675 RepID=A0ABM0VS76_CAMSA|nr:PREDICTED: probable splicing factor 3A subunit 1 [Camelina sativa]
MKRKEFETMKLTAQLAAWYGNRFWLPLRKRAGFEFTNQDNRYFPRFFRFVLEYSIVFAPPKDLQEKMSKSHAYAAAVQDGFFLLLQMNSLQAYRWQEGGVMSLVNWHASLEKDIANMEHDDDEPEPKTQTHTFDEPATLVPEDQFDLAQHPGSAPIKVSVSNAFDITLQSLSQNVASLEEKIAAAIQIPSHRRLKLTGKAGVLEDDNRSLAHYNVEAGDNLTLSLCESERDW